MARFDDTESAKKIRKAPQTTLCDVAPDIEGAAMKAIVSVFARDAKGITAYITAALAEQNINILDISQTLMQGYFTMIMLVDLADCELPFDRLAQFLKEKGEARGLAVHIQRQDIFDAMHRI